MKPYEGGLYITALRKTDAKQLRARYYKPKFACKRGHTTPRYTQGGACVACATAYNTRPDALAYGRAIGAIKRATTHKDVLRDRRRRYWLNRYGLTPEDYSSMLDSQGGACAICKMPPAEGGILGVDHSHGCCPGDKSCGRCVRGLLCTPCNRALGLLKDDPARALNAAGYLAKKL